jgi:hypothetical protein
MQSNVPGILAVTQMRSIMDHGRNGDLWVAVPGNDATGSTACSTVDDPKFNNRPPKNFASKSSLTDTRSFETLSSFICRSRVALQYTSKGQISEFLASQFVTRNDFQVGRSSLGFECMFCDLRNDQSLSVPLSSIELRSDRIESNLEFQNPVESNLGQLEFDPLE